MLGDTAAIATVAVKDLRIAREFYEGKLGLKQAPGEETGAIQYRTGGSPVLVYESQYAGTNQATAVTWISGDVAGTVRALNSRGVTFEHYELPGLTRQGDVHVSGDFSAAWFKDPDGNIHALVSR